MLDSTLYDLSATNVMETENNIYLQNASVEQNVLLDRPMVLLFDGQSFYTVKLPENYDPSHQLVGVVHG